MKSVVNPASGGGAAAKLAWRIAGRLFISCLLWHSFGMASRADYLEGGTNWTTIWKSVPKAGYTLRVNHAGEAGLLVGGRHRFSFPTIYFFHKERSLSMHNDIHGAGPWTKVVGTVEEKADATIITIAGEVLDIRIRQVIRADADSVTWEWNAETFDPTPDMRWFRFEGGFFNCAGFPFTAWLKDGTAIQGMLGTEFQPVKNISALAVQAPDGPIRFEWPAADRVGLTYNAQPAHIPARYACSAAQGMALGALQPGDRFGCAMAVKFTTVGGSRIAAQNSSAIIKN